MEATKRQRLAVIRDKHIGQKLKNGNHVVGNSAKTASSSDNSHQDKEPTTMAIDPKKPTTTPTNKPTTAPAPTGNGAPKAAAAPSDAAKPAKAKKARVRWVSTKNPAYWVRSFKDVTDKYGAPKGPDGEEMVAKAGVPFGGVRDPGAKAARLAAKEAEKARVAAMSDADKLAYAKAKREEKQKTQAAKADADRAALVAQIKAEIAAGKL